MIAICIVQFIVIACLLTKLIQQINKHKADDRLLRKTSEMSTKHLKMFRISDRWVGCYQEKKNIAKMLEERGIKKVAIYGMGFLGKCLYNDLKKSSIEVSYFIDKNYESIYGPVIVRSPYEILPSVDMIVVTAILDYEAIKKLLVTEQKCEICSIEEIIDNLYYK